MASEDGSQPLLDENGWDDIETAARTRVCDVQQLFSRHGQHAAEYLQKHGIARLGEFQAPDNLIFPAFERDPLLTLGRNSYNTDYERDWRRALASRSWTTKRRGGSFHDVAVEAYVVAIRGAARPDKDGLLQPLLKRWQRGQGSQAVFGLPAVQAVINWKWWTYCRKLLLVELAFFLVWFAALNTFTILFQDEDLSLSLPQLLATPRGKAEIAAQLLALVGMAPFLLLEVGTLAAYGWGWLDSYNLLDFSTYAIQIAITTLHLGRWKLKSSWMTVLPALQLILLVFRLQYFSQAFRQTRFAFLDTLKTVVRDMRFMFLYMLLVMWGFGSAFHVIFRRDQEQTEDFDTILHAFATMFEHQSALELKPMYSSKNPYAATSLALLWTFVMGMVLLNLLVAIVVNSLEKATEDADTKMLLSQARMIDELEATIPAWLERRNQHWFPEFVHVLRINPNKLDKVALDSPWEVEGIDGPHHPEQQQPEASSHAASSAQVTDQPPPSAGAPRTSAVPGPAASPTEVGVAAGVEQLQDAVAALRQQLEDQGRVLRRQLEEQGRLLRELAEEQRGRRPPAAGTAEE